MSPAKHSTLPDSVEKELAIYHALSKSIKSKTAQTSRKAITLGAAFLGGAASAHAGIIYSGLQNVSCNIPINSNRCYANINNAGGNDLEIHRNVVAGNAFIQIDEVPGGGFEINGFVAQNAAGYVYPYALAAGVVVGPASPWGFQAGQGNTLSEQNNIYPNDKWTALPNGTTRFVGIRGLVGGLTRYGWVRILKNSFGNLTLIDWAYEDTGAPITTLSTLPVDLMSFAVTNQNRAARLNWATASEQNNAGFEVERSEDGATFRSVGWVAGKGNSAIRQEYLFDDKSIRTGKTYYYRLRQVDIDGHFKYSTVKSIVVSTDNSMAGDLYPNPTQNGKVMIEFSAAEKGTWNVSAFDASGKAVGYQQIKVLKGNNTIPLDFGKLPGGIYYIKFDDGLTHFYRTLQLNP